VRKEKREKRKEKREKRKEKREKLIARCYRSIKTAINNNKERYNEIRYTCLWGPSG
jgi:hypothetical protein